MFGYYRLASAVPQLRVADVDYNVDQLMDGFRKAAEQKAAAVVFPELSITATPAETSSSSRACGRRPWDGLAPLCRRPRKAQAPLPWQGMPFLHEDALYNTAAVIQSGRVLALVPKPCSPTTLGILRKAAVYLRQEAGNRDEGGQSQWGIYSVRNGNHLPRCSLLLQLRRGNMRRPVERHSPSSGLALQGARAIFNPSAGTELTGKAAYRRELVKQQSGRCLCAYVLSSAGVHESTTDTVFGGHSLIADNGRLAAEGERFGRESALILADVDFERLAAARLSESSFNDSKSLSLPEMPFI